MINSSCSPPRLIGKERAILTRRPQKLSFTAFAAKAFTTFFAGFPLTNTSFPNIILLPLLVAFFCLITRRTTPGMFTLPLFLRRSVIAFARPFIVLPQSFFTTPETFSSSSRSWPCVMDFDDDFTMVRVGHGVAAWARLGRAQIG